MKTSVEIANQRIGKLLADIESVMEVPGIVRSSIIHAVHQAAAETEEEVREEYAHCAHLEDEEEKSLNKENQ